MTFAWGTALQNAKTVQKITKMLGGVVRNDRKGRSGGFASYKNLRILEIRIEVYCYLSDLPEDFSAIAG